MSTRLNTCEVRPRPWANVELAWLPDRVLARGADVVLAADVLPPDLPRDEERAVVREERPDCFLPDERPVALPP